MSRFFINRPIVAMVISIVMVLVGGLLWLWGTHFLKRDTELAPVRLPE